MEHMEYPKFVDKNGKRLIAGDVVKHNGREGLFIEICPPLMLACIRTGENEFNFVKPEDLEIVQ